MLLEVISGNAAGASINVDDELLLGRLAADDGRLGDDPELSRHHARISRERDGRYAIEDLGSSNGTFVNGLRITSPGLLSVGDSIELGATTLVVRAIAPTPGEAETTEAGEDPFSGATVFAKAPTAETETEVPPEPPLPPEPPSPPEAPDPFRSATVYAPVPTEEPATPSGPPPGAAEQATSSHDVVSPPPAESPAPPLDLRLRVDFETREAEIALGPDGEPVRLVLESGRWIVAP